jgi:hypothetical protein
VLKLQQTVDTLYAECCVLSKCYNEAHRRWTAAEQERDEKNGVADERRRKDWISRKRAAEWRALAEERGVDIANGGENVTR